jgi:SAM-dependent methyltransferase
LLERNPGGSVDSRESLDFSRSTYGDHLSRYLFACRYSPGMDVLDYGCGTGLGCKLLATNGRGRSVHGVDVDPAAVKLAVSRYSTLQNTSFDVFDGYSTGLPDASFDLIVSLEVIEHVSFVSSYLKEVARLLRPAGRAIFSTPNRNLTRKAYWSGRSPAMHHLREYTARELDLTLRPWFGSRAYFKLHKMDYSDVRFFEWLSRSPLSPLKRFSFWALMRLRWAERLKVLRGLGDALFWTTVRSIPVSRSLTGSSDSWLVEPLLESDLDSGQYSDIITVAELSSISTS